MYLMSARNVGNGCFDVGVLYVKGSSAMPMEEIF